MSHFTVGVIVPTGLDSLREALNTILSPYDENLEVKPYPHECWCINSQARLRGLEMANKLVGPVDEQRKLFTERHADDETPMNFVARNDLFKVETAGWWQSYRETQNDYEIYHPRYMQPNKDCNQCGGSGEYQSTYNPRSKWDYWTIGGRWAGGLGGKDVAAVVDTSYIPFAVVTPDGQWHEKGEMGWWAMVSNEKQQEQWNTIVRGLYEQYPDHLLVLVDAHI